MRLNRFNRIFKNENYLKFIRRLPCAVLGKCGVHPHHVSPKGMSSITNDYYCIPLKPEIHVKGDGHITYEQLMDKIKEIPGERILFYLSLYIEYLEGKYDLEADEQASFIELKRKMRGLQ